MKNTASFVLAIVLLPIPAGCPAGPDSAASPEALEKSVDALKTDLDGIYR